MKEYKPQEFSIPDVKGISKKTIEVHLGLYGGYVTNLNTHYKKIQELCKDPDNKEAISALTRRIPFELAGIRNHEHYFGALENGAKPLPDSAGLSKLVHEQFGSFESFRTCIENTATMMRGIGWAMVAYDKTRNVLHMYWIVDHELGTVNLPTVLAIDMWEHSYMIDYLPTDKGKYVAAYLDAINWEKVEEQFSAIQ